MKATVKIPKGWRRVRTGCAVMIGDKYLDKTNKKWIVIWVVREGEEDVGGDEFIIAAPHISGNAETLLKEKGFSFKKIEPPKHLERHKKSQKNLGEF